MVGLGLIDSLIIRVTLELTIGYLKKAEKQKSREAKQSREKQQNKQRSGKAKKQKSKEVRKEEKQKQPDIKAEKETMPKRNRKKTKQCPPLHKLLGLGLVPYSSCNTSAD